MMGGSSADLTAGQRRGQREGVGCREASVSSLEILIFIGDVLLGSWCLLGTVSGDPGGVGPVLRGLVLPWSLWGSLSPAPF